MNKEKLIWMCCTQCKQVVLQNETGICLKCQGKYSEKNQPDSFRNVKSCEHCGYYLSGNIDYSGTCDVCSNSILRKEY